MVGDKARLLRRLVCSRNELTLGLLAGAASGGVSWAGNAAEGIGPWCGGKLPGDSARWNRCLQAWKLDWLVGEKV